ncbi:hypothetical protein, partial [Pseudonocardia lacus]|uniref:hypothetical protein n=1 Tax=Pseudonocardia lacus TaxID=2835865 RepID=UPI001BDCCE95
MPVGADTTPATPERAAETRRARPQEQPEAAAAVAGAPSAGLGERRVQAASRLGAVDDPAERAADAAADGVMRML